MANQRIVITGAGSGLGRALALAYAQRGARLLLADLDLASAQAVASQAQQRGATAALALKCDVRLESDLQALCLHTTELWQGIDVLVNNAGVGVFGAIDKVSSDDWRFVIDINLWGVIYGCKVFAPRLIAQGYGHILNVASAAAFTALPDMAAYNVSKAGVLALSETLYAELGPRGIGVSVLCPTFFKTNLEKSLRVPDPAMRQRASRFFARATTTADQVAEAAIRGLERGDLYIHPMRDGQKAWRAKRWFPLRYARGLREYQRKLLVREQGNTTA